MFKQIKKKSIIQKKRAQRVRKKLRGKKNLGLAYTPGVAEPCRAIARDPAKVYDFTWKANTILIVTDGTAVLGLGDPDYASNPELASLPATRDEAKSVGDVVLLGKDATETALGDALKQRARWRAVHLACHGLLDTE